MSGNCRIIHAFPLIGFYVTTRSIHKIVGGFVQGIISQFLSYFADEKTSTSLVIKRQIIRNCKNYAWVGENLLSRQWLSWSS